MLLAVAICLLLCITALPVLCFGFVLVSALFADENGWIYV